MIGVAVLIALRSSSSDVVLRCFFMQMFLLECWMNTDQKKAERNRPPHQIMDIFNLKMIVPAGSRSFHQSKSKE
jgi:hypothetical protein